MKKLQLNKVNFAGAEVLGRTELKNVMGGNVPASTDYNYCYNVCMSGATGNSSEMEAKVTACDLLCS